MKYIVLITALCAFLLAPLRPLAALPPSLPPGSLPGLAATGDDFQAVIHNPAALTQGASSGFAVHAQISRQTDMGDSLSPIYLQSLDVFLNSDFFSYSIGFDIEHTLFRHRVGAGIPIGDYFSLGFSAQWPEDQFAVMDISGAFLLRPLPWVSLGAVGGLKGLRSPYIDFSLALRPFTDRITLGVGSSFDGEFDLPLIQAIIEPVDGIRIDGGYNFQDNSWNVGLSLSGSFVRAGNNVLVDSELNIDRTNAYVHISPRIFDSVIGEPPSRMVEYQLGKITEQQDNSPDFPLFPPVDRGKGLLETIHEIHKMCSDPNINGIIFKQNTISMTIANYDEVRKAFAECREAEKQIIFYSDVYGNVSYLFAASIADEIYVHPSGSVLLFGYSQVDAYLKNFLDELGAEVTVYNSHPGKSAFDTFSKEAMTPYKREQLEAIVNAYYRLFNDMLSARNLTVSSQEAIDGGPYLTARRALETGLVDGLMYEDDFDAYVAENYGKPQLHLSGERVARSWPDAGNTKVALIYADGQIVPGQGVQGSVIGDKSIIPLIERAAAAPDMKAILLRVNSPGGSGLASENVARALAKAAEKKPLLVWMGSVAGSGGYYISAPGDLIIASPVTITGSIGVIAARVNLAGLSEELGIVWDGVKPSSTANFDDLSNLFNKESEQEAEIWQNTIASFYETFVNQAAEYREVSPAEIDEVAQGWIWTGEQALENGLVDKLGNYREVMEELANVLGNSNIELVPVADKNGSHASMSFLDALAESLFPRLSLADKLEKELEAIGRLIQNDMQILYLMPRTAERVK